MDAEIVDAEEHRAARANHDCAGHPTGEQPRDALILRNADQSSREGQHRRTPPRALVLEHDARLDDVEGRGERRRRAAGKGAAERGLDRIRGAKEVGFQPLVERELDARERDLARNRDAEAPVEAPYSLCAQRRERRRVRGRAVQPRLGALLHDLGRHADQTRDLRVSWEPWAYRRAVNGTYKFSPTRSKHMHHAPPLDPPPQCLLQRLTRHRGKSPGNHQTPGIHRGTGSVS
ncbi:hypothetical protein A1Q2_05305 [Trichosporon asahii var. asahii CBS 8904]|uniref:Uncharacterized protein n=1 Tax=Trichosporon asahii var. asahii (strain CBS 8904) TaxID=1220162 RepID=K1WFP7_TRIAC|nr:hypothetical protein A1Q2_05305 [Trichosporon asahii var. asahii CBS 8904]